VNPQRRLPAEWEPQEAAWLAWPHNPEDWPGALPAVIRIYGVIVRALAASQPVRLIVRDAAAEAGVRALLAEAGADLGNVRFLHLPTDRGWTRDTLPFFVHAERGPRAVRFVFNGWARYPDHTLDARMAEAAARDAGWDMEAAVHGGREVVLEGGAVDGNGRGDLLATEECLLDADEQCRNPGFSRADYEAVFRERLGVVNVIWLNRGIQGDDTHGHVDDFCRFVAPDTVLLCREDDPSDPNHAAMEENRERLESARLADGSRPHVVRLPMPAPRWFDGYRLPASYGNFLIANRAVLVPVFGDPQDREALGIIGELLPGREIVGVDAVDLILGLGAIHCLTHEQPVRYGAK
jgi:agmatine deiminase